MDRIGTGKKWTRTQHTWSGGLVPRYPWTKQIPALPPVDEVG